MIREVEGDILLTQAEAVAHGVAPNDDFKQGVAHSLRERWPAMYKDFRHFCHTAHPKEGTTWAWGGPGGARIVALFTQGTVPDRGGKPGRASLPNVNHALKALRQNIQDEGYRSVAITRVATGVGGLDWADVKPLIEQHLGDLGIPVFVYSTFLQGVQAQEASL
jgi:O-acetyl-ADP-ribose deacetylase (regulator of RNase III)